MESTTPRVIDDTTTNTLSSRITSRFIRRTAVLGMGVALMAGIATPVFAATATSAATAAKPAAVATVNPGVASTQALLKTAVPAAIKPAAKAAAPAAPSDAALLPHGRSHHGQVSIHTSATQLANAKAIVKASKEMKLPPRAAVIAVATSLQESKLKNYGNLGKNNDHDSLGLFQQRPSCGWGSPSQITNPDHAAKAFLGRLVKVHNWNKLPLTVAAQKVQVSAFGDRYAQWENQAANLVKAVYNAS